MNFYYSYETSPGKFSMKVVDTNGKIIWQSIHPAFITDSLTGQLMPDETPIELGIMKNLDDVEGLERHLKNSMLINENDSLSIMSFEQGGIPISADESINSLRENLLIKAAEKRRTIETVDGFKDGLLLSEFYSLLNLSKYPTIESSNLYKEIESISENTRIIRNGEIKGQITYVDWYKLKDLLQNKFDDGGIVDNGNGTVTYKGFTVKKWVSPTTGKVRYTATDDFEYESSLNREERDKKREAITELNNIENKKTSEQQISDNSRKPITYRYSDFPKSKFGEGKTIRNYLDAVKERLRRGEILDEGTQKDYERYLAVAKQNKWIDDLFEDGGQTAKRKGGSYMERVLENMKYMKSDLGDWKPVPIKGKQKTENDKGQEVEMPIFDFPAGYKNAVSLFPMNTTGDANCELCGKTPIKTVYYIQNDKEKQTLRVGSECVRYVGEGLSGKENLRKAKLEMAKILDSDLSKLASLVYKTFSRVENRGYGRTERSWKTSFIGDGGNSEYWVNLKRQLAELNPTELFDEKKLNKHNKQTIYWVFVYKKIPVFGWESQLNYAKNVNQSESTVETQLLTWFKKNEENGVKLIKQIIETMKVLGYDIESYHSDFLDANDKNIVDMPEFEDGGEVKKNDQPNPDWDINDFENEGAYYDYDEFDDLLNQLQSPIYKTYNWANEGGDPEIYYYGYDYDDAESELTESNRVSEFADRDQSVFFDKLMPRWNEEKLIELKNLYKTLSQDQFEEKFPDKYSIATFIKYNPSYYSETVNSIDIPAINTETDDMLRDVQKHFGGKYNNIRLPNGKKLNLRIADHSANRGNNTGDRNLSVVIANLNATEKFKRDIGRLHTHEIYFDSDYTAEQIIDAVNKEIQEIKDAEYPDKWEQSFNIYKIGLDWYVDDYQNEDNEVTFKSKNEAIEYAKKEFEKRYNKMAKGGLLKNQFQRYIDESTGKYGGTHYDLAMEYKNDDGEYLILDENVTDAKKYPFVKTDFSGTFLSDGPTWERLHFVKHYGDIISKQGYRFATDKERKEIFSKLKKEAKNKMAKGGELTPAKKEKLIKAVAKQYESKKVKPEYQEKYGKRYSKKEAKSVAYAIANTIEKMKEQNKNPVKKKDYNSLLKGY